MKEKLFAIASDSPESETKSPEKSVLRDLKTYFSQLNRKKKINVINLSTTIIHYKGKNP